MTTESTQPDEVLILALARGASYVQAAREAGCSKATVFRRMQDYAFAKRVKDVRAELLSRSVGMLVAASAAAAKTLSELCRFSKNEMVKLSAAKSILELAGLNQRAIDQAETEARIAAIETILNRRKSK